MWDRVLQVFAVRCRHRHLSQPFSAATLTGRNSGYDQWEKIPRTRSTHYVVCLDCGKRFGYDWSRMRMLK
jgi:hypothetical protein